MLLPLMLLRRLLRFETRSVPFQQKQLRHYWAANKKSSFSKIFMRISFRIKLIMCDALEFNKSVSLFEYIIGLYNWE